MRSKLAGELQIENELATRLDGYRQAALAHLTLLLIDLARMAGDVVGDLRHLGEPVLADVFDVIERRHAEPLSLHHVAREVGMTPGHLTTIVRRRTGRTVQEWITESEPWEAAAHLALDDVIEPAHTRAVIAASIDIAWGERASRVNGRW